MAVAPAPWGGLARAFPTFCLSGFATNCTSPPAIAIPQNAG
jgi:hypothetical protein